MTAPYEFDMNGSKFTTNDAGRGVWQRSSDSDGWVKLASPAETPVWLTQVAFAVWVAEHIGELALRRKIEAEAIRRE